MILYLKQTVIKICQYYYYFDEEFNYYCTDNQTCPNKYNTKLINYNNNIKKCIDKCENDNVYNYKYEYKNICYEECPKNTYSIENEFLCYDQKPEGYYLDLIDKKYKRCYDICQNC